MGVSGQHMRQLRDALSEAFTLDELDMMLRTELDKKLQNITTASSKDKITFDVVDKADRFGWLSDLVLAARIVNPGNATLLEAAQTLGAAATDRPARELERIVVETGSWVHPEEWRARMTALESQVCHIEVKLKRGFSYGTGFLVGPDLVMTNQHVLQCVIEEGHPLSAEPGDVRLVFDYRHLADGTVLGGSSYGLAGDWLLDSSPPSPADKDPNSESAVPEVDQLDYALVRLMERAGDDAPVGPKDRGTPRGWVQVPTTGHEFTEQSPLFILQHPVMQRPGIPTPEPEPLLFALDGQVLTVNGNGTRVRYTTRTLRGSSGSPCFSQNWDLVALHHSGDPNFDKLHKAEYNEGIPLSAIIALLQKRGLDGVIVG